MRFNMKRFNMKRFVTIAAMITMLIIMAACELPTAAASIVGKWGIYGIQAMEFTADGRMIMGSAATMMSYEYQYTASGGNGEMWIVYSWQTGAPTKVSFTYVLSGLGGSNLAFTMSGLNMTYYMTRM